MEKIRQATETPVAVGFGVATAMDVSQVAAIADGVIVGSAIVRQIEEHQHDPHLSERVGAFVRSLKSAMTHGRVEVKA